MIFFDDYKASEAKNSKIEIVPVTDARSVFDAVHRLATSFQEKRVEIDTAAPRQTCRNLRWVPTEFQLADVFIKRSSALRNAFRKWMASPTVSLVETKTAADVLDTAPNAAWRPAEVAKQAQATSWL